MKIAPEVLSVIGASSAQGSVLMLPPGQLDRTLYTKVAKALQLVGGKWDRRAGGHVFGGDAGEAIESILMTGEVRDLKKELQAFYTPDALARRVVEAADIQPGMSVLEPSAGHGAIAKAARAAGGNVTCVEINAGAFATLADLGFDATLKDFCDYDPVVQFDRVVMNPPFARQQDMTHVLRAFDMLKPDGVLVSIMSPAFRYRDTSVSTLFRATLEDHGTVTDLPAGSFKESGTTVDTVMVTLRACESPNV